MEPAMNHSRRHIRKFKQMRPRQAVLSWLLPGKPLSAPPHHFDGSPWLTLADDFWDAAAGPSSFDHRSLEWWASHAVCLVVDAGMEVTLEFYDHLSSLVKVHGATVLAVFTVEARRLLWHEYFRSLRAPGPETVVMDVMDDPTRGPPFQLHRMGEMGDDFGPRGPSSPSSLQTVVKVISMNAPIKKEHLTEAEQQVNMQASTQAEINGKTETTVKSLLPDFKRPRHDECC